LLIDRLLVLLSVPSALPCFQVEDQSGQDDEVMWVWKEQQHEFQLAAQAGTSTQPNQQQEQQQQQQGQEGAGQEGELWHIAKGHLQHSHTEQPGQQQQQQQLEQQR
jgi:hypothetical protein